MDPIILPTAEYITLYESMDILGFRRHCPYWSNRIKDGQVTARGFLNGKGEASEIRLKLSGLLNEDQQGKAIAADETGFYKFAKRNRIGLDCSGFIYRLWEFMLKMKFEKTRYQKLEEIFPGGIDKTNARRLTDSEYSLKIKSLKEVRFADTISLNGRRHVVFIKEVTPQKIAYVHASSLLTAVEGVHSGTIEITDPEKDLSAQKWLEKAKSHGLLGKYYLADKGDGIFRLRIYN